MAKRLFYLARLKLAQSIVTEEFIRSYKSINVLGFLISTHRFPLANLFLMLASTVGMAWTVQSAHSKAQRVLPAVQDDDLVDAVLGGAVLIVLLASFTVFRARVL